MQAKAATLCGRFGLFLCMVLIVVLLDGGRPLVRADEPPNISITVKPEDLLKSLRERDHLLDDIILKYAKVRNESFNMATMVIQDWKRHSRNPLYKPIDVQPDLIKEAGVKVAAVFRCNEVMAIRGSTVGFEHNEETMEIASEESRNWLQLHPQMESLIHGRSAERWSNFEGVGKSVSEGANPPYLAIATTPGSLALIDQQVMAIRFTLGFGYANRLLKIDRIERQPDGSLLVTGTIKAWIDDESHCSLTLDKDLIVRRADIRSDIGGVQHEFSIKTTGALRPSGSQPLIADSGVFLKRWLGTLKGGKTIGEPSTVEHFEVEVVSSGSPIPDSEFSRLTTFEVNEMTIVRDISKNVTILSSGQPVKPLSFNYGRLLIVLVNVAFVVALLYYVCKKEKV